MTVTESVSAGSPKSRPNLLTENGTSVETTADLRVHRILSGSELHTTLLRLRLNGIWGMVNLLHGASAVTCTQLFERLVTNGIWLELLRPQTANTHSSSGWINQHVSSHPPTARRCSTGSMNRIESKSSKPRTRSMIIPECVKGSILLKLFFFPEILFWRMIYVVNLLNRLAASRIHPYHFQVSDMSVSGSRIFVFPLASNAVVV